jgi:hypothetical protein
MGFNRAAYIQLRQPSAKAAICSLNAGIFFYLHTKLFIGMLLLCLLKIRNAVSIKRLIMKIIGII